MFPNVKVIVSDSFYLCFYAYGYIPPFNLHMNACKVDLWFSVRKKVNY